MTESEKMLIEAAVETANFFGNEHEKEVEEYLNGWGYIFNDECRKYLSEIDWYCV